MCILHHNLKLISDSVFIIVVCEISLDSYTHCHLTIMITFRVNNQHSHAYDELTDKVLLGRACMSKPHINGTALRQLFVYIYIYNYGMSVTFHIYAIL